MATEDNILLETFRYRFNDLIRAYEKLQTEFENYRNEKELELLQKNNEILKLNEQIDELELRYRNLKTAGMLIDGGTDSEATRNMLNGIVREIDKCIALLNS